MYYVVSILFGLIPEVLYFTIFLIYTKNIKEKRIKLFILLSILYFVCMLLQRFMIIYYLLFIVFAYIILKILYKKKTQIIDIFISGVSYLWLSILSVILMNFVDKDFSNYYMILLIQKILLFMPFIFKNKFNILYKKYCKLWNRNDNEKRPIKSITLRNISLILLNSFIFLLNIAIINIINFQK